MVALASALNSGPRVQALLETRTALSAPGPVRPAQREQAPGPSIQFHAPLRVPGYRAASPVVQRVAAWFDMFVDAALEAFSPRFDDLVGQFLEIAHTARSDAEEDEGQESDLADGVIDDFCEHVMDEGSLGGVIEALNALRHRLPALDGIPRAAVNSLTQLIDKQMAEFRTEIRQQLEGAKAYVEASKSEFLNKKSNADVRGAAESLLRPSSKAHYLNSESTGPVAPISHGKQDKASVYHRSLKHPLYTGMNPSTKGGKGGKGKGGKVDKVDKGEILAGMSAAQQYPPAKLKKGGAAHLGLYPNAMTFERNKIGPPSPDAKLEKPKETSGGDGELYDRSLEYRLDLCRRVVSLAGSLKHLRVLVANDYPLVMVRFDLKAFMADYQRGKSVIKPATAKAFTSFLMNYFLGVANFLAHKAGVNITMVERSSFGFLTPSIAETGESFRINTGMMPPVYADVLARALVKLSAELQNLAEKGAVLPGLPVDAKNAYFDDPKAPARKRKPVRRNEAEKEEEPVEPTARSKAVRKRKRAELSESEKGEEAVEPTVRSEPPRKRKRVERNKAKKKEEAVEPAARSKPARKRKRAELSESEKEEEAVEPTVRSEPPRKRKRVERNKAKKKEKPVEPTARSKRDRYLEIKDAMHLAAFGIEKKNKSAIANATRNRSSLDFVNASAFNAMAKQEFALGQTLVRLLGGMQVRGKQQLTTMAPAATYARIAPTAPTPRDPDEASLQFEKLLAFLRQRLLTLAKEAETIGGGPALAGQFRNIVPLIYGDSPNLEIALELVNELILVHSIRSAQGRKKLEDGYGSDSDVEEGEEGGTRPLRAAKIITHNGMRALLAALGAEKEITFAPKGKGSTMSIRVGSAYYEVSDALKLSGVGTTVRADKAHVLITDINACVTGGTLPQPTKDLTGQYTVWVIDTTSATQAQSATVIRAFKDSGARLLYLISSGFKQEQLGADRNPYGTIRVFADKGVEGKEQIDEVIDKVRASEMPLGAIANIYRRVMKSLGAVPRNENLLAASSTAKPLKPATTIAKPVHEPALRSMFSGLASMEAMERDKFLKTFIASLRSVPRIVDEDASRGGSGRASAEDARSNIYASGSDSEESGASPDWFAVQRNPGGGDCLLHALMGETLEFRRIVEMRSAMADALPQGGAHGAFHGGMAYQTLVQSGLMNEGMRDELRGRHELPREVMQDLVRIPGAYAGDLEVQAFCACKNATVLVVTSDGELRRTTAGGTKTVLKVGTAGVRAFLSMVRKALTAKEIVLYQSAVHWERITGVKFKG